jgi:hypothetical protein
MKLDNNSPLINITALRIFNHLSDDISDRRGLKNEWQRIDYEIMDNELKPMWVKIISDEISLLLSL